MTFRVTSSVTTLFDPVPATECEFQIEGGIAPAPTSVETLRHIADSISGDGAFIMQGILRKAADELEDWEWLREHHGDINCPILVGYSDKHKSLEAAIDAARQAGKEEV
jgi:hypothetical protein